MYDSNSGFFEQNGNFEMRKEQTKKILRDLFKKNILPFPIDLLFDQEIFQYLQNQYHIFIQKSENVLGEIDDYEDFKKIFCDEFLKTYSFEISKSKAEDIGRIFYILSSQFQMQAIHIIKLGIQELSKRLDAKQDLQSLVIDLVFRSVEEFSQLDQTMFSQKELIKIAYEVSRRKRYSIFHFYKEAQMILQPDIIEEILFEYPHEIHGFAEVEKSGTDEILKWMETCKILSSEKTKQQFGVPKEESTVLSQLDDIHDFETLFPIDLERFSQAEELLHGLLSTEYKGCELKYQKLFEKECLLRKKIKSIGSLESESVSKPMFFYFEGDKLQPAIFKSQRLDATNLAKGVPAGTNAQREWLAYQIDKALQIFTTPPTILRSIPNFGTGSVQEWKIGIMGSQLYSRKMTKETIQNFEPIVFDDMVKKNTDRHPNNYLVEYNGQPVGIDHGLIFPIDKKTKMYSVPGNFFHLMEPSDGTIQKIHAFRNSPKIQQALKRCFNLALYEHSEMIWNQFLEQIEKLAPTDGKKGRYQFS